LFWPLVHFKSLDKLLPLVDRIYDLDGRYGKFIEHFIHKNGFVERVDTGIFKFEGKSFHDTISYELVNYKPKWIPYLDTFHCGDKKGDKVTLKNQDGMISISGRENPFYTEMKFSKLYDKEIPENRSKWLEYRQDWALRSDCGEALYGGHQVVAYSKDIVSCKTCGKQYVVMDKNIFQFDDSYVCGRCSVKLTAGKWAGWRVAKSEGVELFNGDIVSKYDDTVQTAKGVGMVGHAGVYTAPVGTSYYKSAEQSTLDLGKCTTSKYYDAGTLVTEPVYWVDDYTMRMWK